MRISVLATLLAAGFATAATAYTLKPRSDGGGYGHQKDVCEWLLEDTMRRKDCEKTLYPDLPEEEATKKCQPLFDARKKECEAMGDGPVSNSTRH